MKLHLLFCIVFIVSFGQSLIQVPLKIQTANYSQKLLGNKFLKEHITATINIGTPKQSFNVILSTAESESWVLGKAYSKKLPNHHTYFPGNSSTSKDLDTEYVDREFDVYGDYYTDVVEFFGIKVENQIFASIYDIGSLNMGLIDGVVGLNHYVEFYYKRNENQTALIDNLLEQVSKPIFNIYLVPYSLNDTQQEAGLLTIGGNDDLHCDYSNSIVLSLQPSPEDDTYMMEMTDVLYGSDSIVGFDPAFGFIDTDRPNLFVPYESFKTIIEKTEVYYDYEHELYVADCGNRNVLENINFLFDQAEFALTPQDYLRDVGLEDGKCALMIDGQYSVYVQHYIFGTVFMRKFCIEYDMKKNSVTIRNHK